MPRKILIHCSTNAGTSNFGDVLFAQMVLEYLQNAGFEASFYDLSEYVRNYLYRDKIFKEKTISMKEADAALYFAGGYFGEKKWERIDRSIRHYNRFMRFGSMALKYKKPIAVIGIGAGPDLWYFSKRIVRNVCNRAVIISTRDSESTAFLEQIGVISEIHTCSDVAQTYQLPANSNTVNIVLENGYEYIFLHTNYQKDVSELFASGVKPYIESRSNIKVIVGADNVVNIDEAVGIARKILGNDKVIEYGYSTPDDLCALLDKCKLILTYKLHVGILASTLGKSVIAVAKHEKIRRYYKQIGETQRCVDFSDCDSQVISTLVEKYYGIKVSLAQDILHDAYRNWELLDNFLTNL